MRPHGLGNQVLYNLFHNGLECALLSLEVASHALFGVLCQDVDLDVDAVALLLLGQDDLLLGVGDEHDLPPALDVVDGGDGQAGAVEGDEALVDDVAQDVAALGLEAQGDGVAVGGAADDGGDAVDVALDKVAAHAGVGADGALEVDARAGVQVAQVRQAQRLGRDAHGEVRGLRLGGQRRRRQAHAVDGDAVAQDGVGQQRRRRRQRDRQRGAARLVLRVELGDLCSVRWFTRRSAFSYFFSSSYSSSSSSG